MEYLALWQSFIGALAAFGVASFTVWISNKHANEREVRQAHRAKDAERQGMLREKLETLVASCEVSFSSMIAITDHQLDEVKADRDNRKLPAKPTKLDSFVDSISTASATARIYFPSLAEPVSELHRQLKDYALEALSRAMAARADVTLGLERPDSAKVKAIRFAILDEARRLIENNFAVTND